MTNKAPSDGDRKTVSSCSVVSSSIIPRNVETAKQIPFRLSNLRQPRLSWKEYSTINTQSTKHLNDTMFLDMTSKQIRDKPVYDLSDLKLFGNDAADDEPEEIFKSYFCPRDEVSFFTDPKTPLAVLRAFRGEGKSAILKKSFIDIRETSISIHSKGSNLSPDVTGTNPDKWMRGWKENIYGRIAAEIGSTLNLAFLSDAMELVRIAENGGFRSTGLVTYLTSRLKIDKIPQVNSDITRTNDFAENLLQRYLNKPVWFFIDDIDENYQDTTENNLKIAAFFSACRDIVASVPDIRIRTVVRPNIWTIVRRKQEGLSKVEQYVRDIRWNEDQVRSMLANRVLGYLDRTNQEQIADSFRKNKDDYTRERSIICSLFEANMPWGGKDENGNPKHRPANVVLNTLSRGRPRWLIGLCKIAASEASKDNKKIIEHEHIIKHLDLFGRERINDISAEYSSLCPQLPELINAFIKCKDEFNTNDLFEIINRHILPHITVYISGERIKEALRIAALLFEIDFISGKEIKPDGSYVHFSFVKRPELFHNRINPDHGLKWEIHPVFRQALLIR